MTHKEFTEQWQAQIIVFLDQEMKGDSAHDMEHIRRVVRNATHIGHIEQADMGIVLASAWLHDCITIPKNSPLRSQASRLAADKAEVFLRAIDYPSDLRADIRHAIEAHSFTANITPTTIEAKVVQDADRLDAIGAVGIARCLMTGGMMHRPLYYPPEPLPVTRMPNDDTATIDHFYTKLFTLPALMQTSTARAMAVERVRFMEMYLTQLNNEIQGII